MHYWCTQGSSPNTTAQSEMFSAASLTSGYTPSISIESREAFPPPPLLINHKSAPMFFWEMVFTEKPKQEKKKNVI